MIEKRRSLFSGICLLVMLVAFSARPSKVTLAGKPGFAPPSRLSSQNGPVARFKWSVPERFGEKDQQGIFDYHWNKSTQTYLKTYINPGTWRMNFDACASTGGESSIDNYALEIGGQLLPKGPDCRFTHEFPALGTYPVKLVVTAKNGQNASTQADLHVKDYLIVSIGDSFASGQGNPDIRAGLHKAIWEDEVAHRSSVAGPAQAALSIEAADPHTSVTFISFACSGATIEAGLIGPQNRHGVILRPQMEKVLDSLGGRTVDALLISIGGNDIGFEKLVENMVKPGCSDDIDPDNLVGKGLEKLPGNYEGLNKLITAITPLPKVFITEYPDILHDGKGAFCDRKPAIDVMHGICEKEAAAAVPRIITPLNEAVNTAATKWGWIYVGGISSAFRTHGYCAGEQRWALLNRDSLRVQRDIFGTAHPNNGGHAWYATRLIEEMRTAGVTTPPVN